ncbi:MAG: hypothetical protein LBB85_02545 [Dysgonamonadaceae bacterium]|jgi:hypothetical protein|nr:hypothetical protein [Dysgonamonadaceae bacterium]
MKRVLFTVICILGIFVLIYARNRADWQEYAGRYAFSVENLAETLEIVLQGDTALTAFTPMGEIALTYVEKDRFEFPQYGGVVVFERDETQKITACRISVAAMDMEEIKAKKQ